VCRIRYKVSLQFPVRTEPAKDVPMERSRPDAATTRAFQQSVHEAHSLSRCRRGIEYPAVRHHPPKTVENQLGQRERLRPFRQLCQPGCIAAVWLRFRAVGVNEDIHVGHLHDLLISQSGKCRLVVQGLERGYSIQIQIRLNQFSGHCMQLKRRCPSQGFCEMETQRVLQ